jgi:aminoglycoside 3-N-acetyltransferase
MKTTVSDIRQAAQALRFSGRVVCVHASLRSFGFVDGGSSAVLQGLFGEGCTIMAPTFSWSFAGAPPLGRRIAQNGWDEEKAPSGSLAPDASTYGSECNEIDVDMGAVSAALLKTPGRVRGDHPLSSFAAAGTRARELIAGQKPLDVMAPLKRLADLDGLVVLMGVGLESMTLLHLAEQLAGRGLFRRWARGPDGTTIEVEVGGCSDGFANLEPMLRSLVREIRVGGSRWCAFPAAETLRAAAAAIRGNPSVTRCPDSTCKRCHDAIAGGPQLA